MGYDVRFQGYFDIKPPFAIAEGDRPNFAQGEYDDIELRTRKAQVDIPGVGPAVATMATIFVHTEGDRAAGPFEAVTEALRWVNAHDATLDGTLYAYGEEDGDIRRWRIEDDTVIEERPKLLWPNGEVTGVG